MTSFKQTSLGIIAVLLTVLVNIGKLSLNTSEKLKNITCSLLFLTELTKTYVNYNLAISSYSLPWTLAPGSTSVWPMAQAQLAAGPPRRWWESQAYRWCFTINNYSEDEERNVTSLGGLCKYLICGREVGESSYSCFLRFGSTNVTHSSLSCIHFVMFSILCRDAIQYQWILCC